ncbi:PilZ domain-containing protein [Hathewaya proteolytica DSM 3090]|uniref:PilZ domain-containing protein n=1 Tax=Hathewaya proteolytica DSM 3090 TaxID=1121331 RepID=A0A1M6QE21_9CLOT|nr:PilZ domain-containing protein [Hathewaya proteolytica]SHK18492.1 PilZ domain-containing protein [Hathewaya proteolytica DSM 3090]
MIEDLNILDNVDICVLDNINDKRTYYKTNIIEKNSDNIFYTGYIAGFNSSMISDKSNLEYMLMCKTPKGIFSWKSIFLGNKKIDNILGCEFKAIAPPVKTQKREFFRQPVCLPLCFSIVKFNNKPVNDITLHDGTMFNISGGGCAFTSKHKVNPNYTINISFKYKNSIYCLDGRVLSSVKTPVTNLFEYRLQWENNNPKITEDIISLLCIMQREKIKT